MKNTNCFQFLFGVVFLSTKSRLKDSHISVEYLWILFMFLPYHKLIITYHIMVIRPFSKAVFLNHETEIQKLLQNLLEANCKNIDGVN